MLQIHDPVLAQMWREKSLISVVMALLGFVFSDVFDYFVMGRPYVTLIMVMCTLLLFAQLWHTRYRMSNGSFGKGLHEAADLKRWLRRKGGIAVPGVNLD